MESRKTKKMAEKAQLEKEEAELLSNYQTKLAGYYMEQKQIVENEQGYRQELRERYKKEAEIRKYKYRMAMRHQNRNSMEVLQSLNEYGSHFLWMHTDDDTLYKYQRRLWTDLQWNIFKGLPVGCLFGYAILSIVRQFKKRGNMDLPLYFGMPLLYWGYAKSATYQQKLFEIGYPAHPSVIEKRRKCINQCCFFAPSMIKNEIEYMHSKIDGVIDETDLVTKSDENKYEKEFQTGKLGLSLLKKDSKEGKKFKIIVEHGELYLECLDSFEEIFEVKRDLVEKIELTNILDPYMFDNHRDIVNAMFETYFEIGENYLTKYYDPLEGTKIKIEAQDRVEKKYGIGRYSTQATIVEKMATQEMQDTKKLLTESMR